MKPRKYQFNNSTLTIVFGNITQSKAEVIVSSDDTGITMGGGVSRAILAAGGEIIRRDAQRKLPAQLGDVVVSTAGEMLHQKFIFHCTTLSYEHRFEVYSGEKNYSEEIQKYVIQHSVDKCFNLIHALDLNSIAFPCLGAGSAHFSMEKVAEVMADVISDNLCKTQKGFNVELYIFDNGCGAMDYIDIFEHFAIKSAFAQQQSIGSIRQSGSAEPAAISKDVEIPRREDMRHSVFISYARKDTEKVKLIRDILDESGISYWIDKEGIFSGENYKEVIVDAIDAAKAVIFVSSEASNASINVIRELGYAVKQRKTIVPVLLDDTQYAKSIRLDIADIDQIEFDNSANTKTRLIVSIKYALNV